MRNGMFFILSCAIIFIAGCRSKKEVSNPFPDSINGTYLILMIEDGDFTQSFSDSSYRIVFEETYFSAFIGCNNMGGGYRVQDSSVVFEAAFSTKMYCRDKAAQEIALINGLQGTKKLEFSDSFTFLKGGETLLKLRKMN